MPPDVKGGSRAAEPGNRHKNIATATAKRQGPSPAVSVRRGPAKGRREAVTCRVSLLVPNGRRTRWWYLATCPVCSAPHLGRAPDLADVTGPRRLPCGHDVVIAIARTYGRTGAAA